MAPRKSVPKVSVKDFNRSEMLNAWPAHTKMEHPVHMHPVSEEVDVDTGNGIQRAKVGDWLCFDETANLLWVISDSYKQMHYRRT